jgi:hypothetical protein
MGEISALAPIIFLAALGERGFFLRKSAKRTSVARKKRQRLFLENPRKLPSLGAEVIPWRKKSARGFSCYNLVTAKACKNMQFACILSSLLFSLVSSPETAVI